MTGFRTYSEQTWHADFWFLLYIFPLSECWSCFRYSHHSNITLLGICILLIIYLLCFLYFANDILSLLDWFSKFLVLIFISVSFFLSCKKIHLCLQEAFLCRFNIIYEEQSQMRIQTLEVFLGNFYRFFWILIIS